jgi:hypothetical protein
VTSPTTTAGIGTRQVGRRPSAAEVRSNDCPNQTDRGPVNPTRIMEKYPLTRSRRVDWSEIEVEA